MRKDRFGEEIGRHLSVARYISHEPATGVVSNTLRELEGGIMSSLATQTGCSEHATRMSEEYLRCAPARDRGHASIAQRSGHRRKCGADCGYRTRSSFLDVTFVRLGVKGET